jgi:hypothetical protein
MTTLEILEGAHKLINEIGWCQGLFYRYGGPTMHNKIAYCLVGALIVSCRHQHPEFIEAKSLIEYVENIQDLSKWNDSPGRTKEEVLKLIEETMERIDKGNESNSSST